MFLNVHLYWCWCQMRWYDYFKNSLSTGILSHNDLQFTCYNLKKREAVLCLADVRDQKMARLPQPDRQGTKAQITTCYS